MNGVLVIIIMIMMVCINNKGTLQIMRSLQQRYNLRMAEKSVDTNLAFKNLI